MGSLSQAKQLAVGDTHSCALLADATVRCWGSNSFGQLGNGTVTDSSSPVQVSNVTTAISISSGDYYTCALTSGGGVFCWGNGNYGQLGNGSLNGSTSPVRVSNISNAIGIGAGSYHNCAALSDGGQQLKPKQFSQLMNEIRPLVEVMGKTMAGK